MDPLVADPRIRCDGPASRDKSADGGFGLTLPKRGTKTAEISTNQGSENPVKLERTEKQTERCWREASWPSRDVKC